MRPSPYVRQGRNIAAADKGGIRERWLWGLRLLRDPKKMAASGKSLKHGVVDELIQEATADGQKLSAREIQARLQCARTYSTESQIRRSTADFDYWSTLVQAGFPPYDADPGEPPADHRTDEERKRARDRDMAEAGNEQLALFPADRFDGASTLKELIAYAAEMAELTARFAARDQERLAYVNRLVAAVDGDLSATWRDAHDQAYGPGDVIDLRVVAA